MAIPFLNNIDLTNNQLLNAKLQVTGTQPQSAPGQIYFDSSLDVALYHDNNNWVRIRDTTLTSGAFVSVADVSSGGTLNYTVDLSAAGTPDATVYLRGDNVWAPISGIPGTYEFTLSDNANPAVSGVVAESDTVTIAANSDLTSNLTGQASASKLLTVGLKVNGGPGVSDNYVVNQTTAVAKDVDSIPFNDYTPNANPALETNVVKKTTFGTIPIEALALVKQYIDNSVAGGLIYQGGFDGSTGFVTGTSNYLDDRGTQIAVNKGWTYTVTDAGTFYGEVVEVGDVLIAEDNLTSGTGTLSDWTTVQNNVDLASLVQVGIGNVNPEPAGNLGGIAVSYNAGTAKVGLGIATLAVDPLEQTPADYFIPIYNAADDENKKVASSDLLSAINSATSFSGTIGNGSATSIRLEDSGAVAPNINHGLGDDSTSFMIQLVDVSSGETVYADVARGAGGQVTIDFAAPPAILGISVLIQKIG